MPDGGTVDVATASRVREGQILQLRGKGPPSLGEGPTGDAFIELTFRPNPFSVLDGDDIRLELPVTLKEAVLGAKVTLQTPIGAVIVSTPSGSSTGTVLRLRGKGSPRKSGGQGDEIVVLKVMLRASPDPGIEELVSKWSPKTEGDPRQEMKS